MKRFILVFAATVNLLFVDALTKELAAGYLKGSAALSIIDGFFNLAYVENRGCAWGMFQGQVWPLAIFALVALGLLIWQRRSLFVGKLGAIAEPVLYAGIIGNLVDRVCRGYVIDFVDLHWKTVYHFPCFNVADICICTSAGLLLLSSFLTKEAKK